MRKLGPRPLARTVTAIYAVSLFIAVLIIRPGCLTIEIWASVEKSELLSEIAERYERGGPTEDFQCVRIRVTQVASGEAEEALSLAPAGGGNGLPVVWAPAASTWLALLDRHRSAAGRPALHPTSGPPIVQSPLVIGMLKPMAEALGWPRAEISFKEIFALASDPQGWATRGHPEWGRFKLAKTNPRISTSGLHALVATYLMSGASSPDDPAAFNFVRDVERAVLHYSSTVRSFLLNLAEADDGGEAEALSYVSAIVMEEKQVWDYNEGRIRPKPALPPHVKLVAVYPSEGTMRADHPYAVMSWVSDQERRAALKFFDYLKTDPVQKLFLDNAFRGAGYETGAPIDNSAELNRFKPGTYFAVPEPVTLTRVQSLWDGARKKARVLVILDTAESMSGRIGLPPASKLDLAKAAWSPALAKFVDDDDVGLWALAGVERRKILDIRPLRDQRAQLQSELAALTARGTGKGLYAAINEGVAFVRQGFARDRINAVVVLTDGKNDDPANSDLNGLLTSLRRQSEDDRVRVFTIAYGPSADADTLERIAHAARGTFYPATEARAIDRVLLDVVSNF
jgi:Ca-activated chloride channel family protein